MYYIFSSGVIALFVVSQFARHWIDRKRGSYQSSVLDIGLGVSSAAGSVLRCRTTVKDTKHTSQPEVHTPEHAERLHSIGCHWLLRKR